MVSSPGLVTGEAVTGAGVLLEYGSTEEAGDRGCSRLEEPIVRDGRVSDFLRGIVVGISKEGVALDTEGFAALEENLTSAPSCPLALMGVSGTDALG